MHLKRQNKADQKTKKLQLQQTSHFKDFNFKENRQWLF